MLGNAILVLFLMVVSFVAGFCIGETRQLKFGKKIEDGYRRLLYSTRPDVFADPDAPIVEDRIPEGLPK